VYRQRPSEATGERDATPLLTRGPGERIAWFDDRAITALEYLGHVAALMRELPDAPAVINLCADRYRFLVAFGAALARGMPTLLPPNPLATTLADVAQAWPGSVELTDASVSCAGPPPDGSSRAAPPEIPRIPGDRLAAVLYTSGSTGSAQPQPKRWDTLSAGARINLRPYFGATVDPVSIVATVPPQHMYGLEATVMLTLLGRTAAHSARPLYPADVVAALEQVPSPRMLVSTPVHLSALIRSGLALPPLARVVSATAPLDAALAAAVEQRCGAELIEIYGCTEIGSMAARRASRGERWRFFAELEARVQDESTTLRAPHLPAPFGLPDRLQFHADGSFTLLGRNADLVKIGGKRGSLAEVTRALLAIPGVDDAAAYQFDGDAAATRIAAFYVSDSADVATVRAALRRVLDPAFLPRPLRRVTALPRSPTGKLPRTALLELHDRSGPVDDED
jgi:acyl-coenzyme A synthetase/AMP-(fatty) acid ligase